MDFENGNVLQQLRCGGVLEAVRISCAGFPTKFPFEDFVDHFWNLVPELLARDDLDDADLARAACQKARLQGFQIGRTKVPTLQLICPTSSVHCSPVCMVYTIKTCPHNSSQSQCIMGCECRQDDTQLFLADGRWRSWTMREDV